MRLFSSACLAVFALCACQSAAEVAPEPVAVAAEVPPQGKQAYLPFRLDMTFSRAAATALQRSGDQVIIAAKYYGVPKPGVSAQPPGVLLNDEIHAIEARDGAVRMRGAFDLDRATSLTSGDPRVFIIAASALTAGPEAILSCGSFDESLPLAVETGGMIHCELASE